MSLHLRVRQCDGQGLSLNMPHYQAFHTDYDGDEMKQAPIKYHDERKCEKPKYIYSRRMGERRGEFPRPRH